MYRILVLICAFHTSLQAQNKFSKDAVLRKLYGFEYERQTDSLTKYLSDVNPVYRFAAIKGMASVQDTSITAQLFSMLEQERIDSVKLALVYSLSQLDCHQSYNSLLKYYNANTVLTIQAACIEAIGKVSKHDVSDFFTKSYKTRNKPDSNFISHWMRGVLLAKRRKHIDLDNNNRALANCLEDILTQQAGNASEINYCYSKIMQQPEAVDPDQVKRSIKSLSEIEAEFKALKNPYLQQEFITKFDLTAPVCIELINSDYHSLIRSHGLSYYLKFHSNEHAIDESFIQGVFDQLDAALIAPMCEHIAEQNKLKKDVAVQKHVLQNLQRQLLLPRDFESWIDLERAILSYEGKEYQYRSFFETGYTNPIDWNFIIGIPENQKLMVKTTKGNFVLMLKVNESPASVANFLKLVDKAYYNGKYFHRMVPNFVVQGGCPRGDGYGSLDWNQRSELSGKLRYNKGSVGLASVGKDSEGVQFFVTHNYAPHLDGKYTIFAEVISGLPVIDQLVVGDQIISIEKIQ